jgi:acyl-CoA hydrolase
VSATVGSHAEAARLICDRGDDLHIVAGMYPGQPDDLLRAVVAEAGGRGVRLTVLLADLTGKLRFLDPAEPNPPRLVTVGGRAPRPPLPAADYPPSSLWEIARRFTDGTLRVDVFVGMVAPPRDDGTCSFGPILSYGPSAMAAADHVVLEVNHAMPAIPGWPGPHRDDVHVLVDTGLDRVAELRPARVGPVQREIGARLAALIPNGATLQLGIGSIPEGFLAALRDHRDLGIHSGAIPEAAIELIDAGVFTGAEKSRDTGRHVTTSLLGSRRLYEYAADPAHGIRMQPVSVTHAPAALVEQRAFYSVNSALEVDLTGQANAEWAGGARIASGGGQVDFGKWAHVGDGAHIIALPARSPDGRPRITAALSAPHVVTTHRNDVDFVVTEFGVADLRGRTVEQRCAALVAVADPADRPALLAAWRDGLGAG